MQITRTTGQSSALPGAVIANGVVYTSGLIDPSTFDAMTSGAEVDFETQVAGAVDMLLATLAEAGSDPTLVVRIDAYLASADDQPGWNKEFARVWPTPGPARTTVVVNFASPAILFELNAIALVAAQN